MVCIQETFQGLQYYSVAVENKEGSVCSKFTSNENAQAILLEEFP